MLALLPTTTALLALLSAPRPVPTARARPVALSIATWGELEARLPSSLAPEPLIVDSALARDFVTGTPHGESHRPPAYRMYLRCVGPLAPEGQPRASLAPVEPWYARHA